MTRVKRTSRRSKGGDVLLGRLVAAVVLSWGVYVVLDRFTVAPAALALWLSAAAALTLTIRAGRR
ncbi:hypothetical protein [Nonomuraea gerenzanensis]|uniref:hypothetical protein n=1 Tax=Nonomuraea gerenzanensis TaxID=93944 RepID=UPI001CDA397D|nr:hypothetical protein [Nonomuraea gerenzanensis]UBU19192.1 hypothetical protein LCN96_56330 [Nonomuraea gerenzanensis]